MSHMRGYEDGDRKGGSGHGKKCLDLGCILEDEPTGLTSGLQRCLPVSDLKN